MLAVAVLPRESVTVTLIFSVPVPAITPVVNDAAVYVFPSAVVLYDLIVDGGLRDAVASIFSFAYP